MRKKVEEWRPIPGWEESYEASSFGRIRSLPRIVERHLPDGRVVLVQLAGCVLRPQKNKVGYLTVGLWRNRRVSTTTVHSLICSAFHGLRPPGLEAAHRDGIKANCSPENLRWTTPEENNNDKVEHGTAAKGERHGFAKLTQDDVRFIRRNATVSPTRLAERFGVSDTTIRHARDGKTWKHIP